MYTAYAVCMLIESNHRTKAQYRCTIDKLCVISKQTHNPKMHINQKLRAKLIYNSTFYWIFYDFYGNIVNTKCFFGEKEEQQKKNDVYE